MSKTFRSFSDCFNSGEVEFKKEVKTVVHNDENIANNRLFVWNFEGEDLREFVDYFMLYKNGQSNDTARQALNGNLLRKMHSLQSENYNPIEPMLYASKVINTKLENDTTLREILAERIRDVYLRSKYETTSVLKNIMKMWSWSPQVKVVITAIGLIGDNQELLDEVMFNYSQDANYKLTVFYALIKQKTVANLERTLQIIMNLQDTEGDNRIGGLFKKEIKGFGYEGYQLLQMYNDNPGVSRIGAKIIQRIILQNASLEDTTQDKNLYLKTLANKSAKDDDAYRDFENYCYENYDDHAFYLSRFSRPSIGKFLKTAIEDRDLAAHKKNAAIISMANIGKKGFTPAKAIIEECGYSRKNDNAVMLAKIILNDKKAARQLANVLSQHEDYELTELYGLLRSSNIAGIPDVASLVGATLEDKFKELVEEANIQDLGCLCSNLQMFWDKKLYSLITRTLLDMMKKLLNLYADNEIELPTDIVISLLEITVCSWNSSVEAIVFKLYRNSNNERIRQLSLKKLRERKIEAPK